MKLHRLIPVLVASVFFFSCVSSKKYKTIETQYMESQDANKKLQGDLSTCNDEKAKLGTQKSGLENDIANLNKQIDFLKQNNTQALKQLEDLSVITSSQAERIRKSLENLGAKGNYSATLLQQMAHKVSLNMALVRILEGAMGEMIVEDRDVKVESGGV